jgi:hypothetical protein
VQERDTLIKPFLDLCIPGRNRKMRLTDSRHQLGLRARAYIERLAMLRMTLLVLVGGFRASVLPVGESQEKANGN